MHAILQHAVMGDEIGDQLHVVLGELLRVIPSRPCPVSARLWPRGLAGLVSPCHGTEVQQKSSPLTTWWGRRSLYYIMTSGIRRVPTRIALPLLAVLVLPAGVEGRQPQGAEAAPFIELLLELRAKLRVVKQYALADEVRNRLTDLGVVVEDTREGSTWRMER